MTILVTGGAGYIGSHTVLQLIEDGFEVVILDNLSNSSQESLRRVESLVSKKIPFIEGDINDQKILSDVFSQYDIKAVIHFAGLKSVGESVKNPIDYYINNVSGSLLLLDAMRKANVKKIIFSSSATVYGNHSPVPNLEHYPIGNASCPYGTTKIMLEQILSDYAKSDSEMKVIALRYFNPTGAHPSGLIGEDPNGIPNNLVPYISQVAIGKLAKLSVYGGDYETIDGTGVRDFIHVDDLAAGHVSALKYLDQVQGYEIFNLGTGHGVSVLQVIEAFEKASNTKINYEIIARREGDIGSSWADATKAEKILGWKAKYDINDMMKHTWNWQKKNPNGYQS
ncbi:UDP-glucose 4-epimerase GalE [Atlantibacter hermannii]|uniref:UDP-glucose 4-epimerase GalE n=1 Tax=Atlantibacter hermannii TaxID=565 RepID=UPI0019331856|nr:UDP-glucose 4-epimerase GalE [Atlantibacter hermannii]MBL7675335.1 UDP-glucose 4-epimerase GalE [Atlantibacter hermannii]MCZ7834540.1 UDP-glucose 4-epimerase GalE [Atlantibacter hermannii]